MSKNTKILTGIILILLVISSIGIFLNRDNIRRNRELNENAVFEIYEEGQFSASYTMEEIMDSCLEASIKVLLNILYEEKI
ncbi:MAG: hypothetical protein H0S78_05360 [Tissierellales bacterium]|nr:hypothetical protein [Tissierellales bacterium]